MYRGQCSASVNGFNTVFNYRPEHSKTNSGKPVFLGPQIGRIDHGQTGNKISPKPLPKPPRGGSLGLSNFQCGNTGEISRERYPGHP